MVDSTTATASPKRWELIGFTVSLNPPPALAPVLDGVQGAVVEVIENGALILRCNMVESGP
jgi:hypothetical protein